MIEWGISEKEFYQTSAFRLEQILEGRRAQAEGELRQARKERARQALNKMKNRAIK